MVKTTNTRITITISKKQYKWLENLCAEKSMKMSKLISWMLYQKSNDVEHTKNLLENPKEELDQVEEESLEEFRERIIATTERIKREHENSTINKN